MHRCVPILLVAAWLFSSGTAAAQDEESTLANMGCPPRTNYEMTGYRVRDARVRQPFAFVRRVGGLTERASGIAAQLAGKPFTYASLREVRDEIEALEWLPDVSGERVRIEVFVTSVENCLGDELDVVYSVYSAQIAAPAGLTREGTREVYRRPQTAAGADIERGIITVKPLFSYNATEEVGSGMSAIYRPVHFAGVLDAVAVSAAKMPNGRMLETSLVGAREHDTRWLARSAWTIAYRNTTTPAFAADLRRAQATAQYSLLTQPIKGAMPLRFGVEAGGAKHDTTDATLHSIEENGHYRTAKLLVGLTVKGMGNTISASYGVELGSTQQTSHTWRKHIVDIADDVSIPLRNRQLEVESRLSLGRLHATGPTPSGTQFFGGNKEELFTPDLEWQLRSNPMIRSIPANQFTHPDGAEAFAAFNLTAAYPLKRIPMVPAALTEDPSFNPMLENQLVSAENTLAVDYYTKDEHFKAAAAILSGVASNLLQLKTAVAARAADAVLFKTCANAINTAERRTRSAQNTKGASQYGNFGPLLPPEVHENGEDRLNAAVDDCESANAGPQDASITTALARLRGLITTMVGEFKQVDKSKAGAAAAVEVGLAKRTLHTILYQANIFSVGPAFMFDVARLTHAGNPITRYGVGGGVRLTLVSSVNFTIGYVANPNRTPTEPRGALTVSMQFRDFLQ